MKKLVELKATAQEFIASLAAVNREVAGIDRFFVAWTWVTWIFNDLKTLAFFVGGSVVVDLLTHRTMTPTLAFGGLAAYALYMVLNSALSTLYVERRQIFELALNARIQQQKTEHFARLDLGRLVDPAFKEIVDKFETRGSRSVWTLWYSQMDLIAASVAAATGAAVLLRLDWLLSILALLIVIPNVAERWLSEQRRREIQEQQSLTRRRLNEIFDALAKPDSAVLMRLLRYTASLARRYGTLSDSLMENLRTLIRYERTLTVCTTSITLVSVLVFGSYFAMQLKANQYTLTELGAIIGSFQVLSGSIRGFGWALASVDQERRDFDYLRKFLATKPLVDETGFRPMHLDRTPAVRVSSVTFSYPGEKALAIDSCSITIEAGEKVALVGPNGSGKTTLLRLLSRIYLPTEGEILVGQHSLNQTTQRSWLQHHVMLTQGSKLPGFSIEYAVSGAEHDQVDSKRFWTALRSSRADSFVAKLPTRESTCIGAEWPDGHGFSTGELQRLALSAALYRLLDDATLVASFDEPTANCDAETKEAFYETITKSPDFASKTILVALHDPIYLHFFDRVVLFENGTIKEDLRGHDRISAYRDRIIHSLSADL